MTAPRIQTPGAQIPGQFAREISPALPAPILITPEREPVAWYRLSETGGATVAVDDARGNSGTIAGAPTQGVAAPTGFAPDTATRFDGVDDYVTAPNTPGNDTPHALTARIWFRSTAAGAFDVLFGRGSWSGVGWWVKASNDGTGIGWTAQGLSITNAGVGGTPWDGAWHQFVGTYDGARLRAYLDGVLGDDWPSTGTLAATTEPLQIGRIAAQDYFPGDLYGAQLYPFAWSPEEVAADYEAGIATAGAALTADLGDTLTLTDTASAASGVAASVGDTLSLADAATITRGVATPIADTLALTDAATTARGATAAPADTLTLADVASTARGVGVGVADTLALADTATAARGVAVSVADSVTVADTIAAGVALAASVADTLTLADSATTASGVARTAAPSDTLTLADSVTPAAGIARGLADTLTLADALTAVLAAGAAVERGTLEIADAPLGAVALADAALGSATLADAPLGAVELGEISGTVTAGDAPRGSIVLEDTLD